VGSLAAALAVLSVSLGGAGSSGAGSCDPVAHGRLEAAIFVRRTRCRAATRVVEAWRLDRDCVTTSREVRACRVAGRSCAPVSGGRLSILAGVSCPSGRSQIELVLRTHCPELGFGRGLEAINTSCAVARPLARRWERRDDCGPRACTVAGWRCRPLTRMPQPPTWRCRNGHSAFEILQRIIIEG
jgi:hypothetical protein